MTRGARRIAIHGLLLFTTAALLGGCGQKKTAASNVVQMRDMEVVDGTTNDAMTDLDAVSASGTGIGNNAGNASSVATKAKTAPEENAKDAEAVPSE
ncbi:MAG: hypothetical protein J7494_01275 [Sphingobium sp.]|nr:hypothetical protein [Sphingobium sp.]